MTMAHGSGECGLEVVRDSIIVKNLDDSCSCLLEGKNGLKGFSVVSDV